MTNKMREIVTPRLVLAAETAAELMRPNPVSIRGDASVGEAVALLSDKGFSAAPVIDESGRPVGVVSRSDILVHDRERTDYVPAVPDYYEGEEIRIGPAEFADTGFQVVDVDRTCVRDIMTPVVFAVSPHTPPRKVISEMLSRKVHRLFVVDSDGVLVGVISATDVLRYLR
jgi:CBS domain-containing protein